MEHSAIRLCGRVRVRLAGRDVELPRRQARLVFAYLVCARDRAVARDELIELLWPADPPDDPGEALSALLSRMRRVLGPEVIEGRRDLGLVLPDDTHIDLVAAHEGTETAEAALAAREWRTAWEAAGRAARIAGGGFMSGDGGAWIEERRRELEELRVRALELVASAGLELRGAELPGAERAARELVKTSPFAESGHRLLMEALAARGDVAEALRAYERLRVLLRDELGTPPGPAVQELHRRLLAGEVDAPVTPPAARAAAPPQDERKLVTVLCADPGRAGDPEEIRAALAVVQELAEQFGGTIQAPGVALFGAFIAHEDDPERAIAAALAACERGVARRAAIASGEAIVAGQGRTAVGDVVARASALLADAPDGRVRIDDETARAAKRAVEIQRDDGGALARGMRGRRTPAWGGPLVGRAREMAALDELYGGVVDRASPLLVTITGEAGVGKSRLVEEFARRVEDDGTTVYRGRCLPYGERIAFWPLREILCDASGVTLDDAAHAAREKVRALGRRLRLDAATTAVLAGSAGIPVEDEQLDGASTPDIQEEIGIAWPRFLSAHAPLVLVIEDLHWANPALLATLERIVARTGAAVLLLATARPEFAEQNPGWSARAGMAHIALDTLSETDARTLATSLLPHAGERRSDQVVELAEGNPFFMEELVRHLEGRDDVAASLPHTLRALVAARIDALPSIEKTTLQQAAVMGRQFWLSALEPHEAGEPLPAVLRSLEERGLVVVQLESALPGEREYWFAHGLTREVAYQSLPLGARCRRHAAAGAWIECIAGDRREEFIHLLAYHYEAAASLRHWRDDADATDDIRVTAVNALVEAGAAARRGHLSVDPLDFADRALQLAKGDRERLAVLELRAGALHAALRADDALVAYLDAIDLARALGDAAAAARLRARAALLCTRYAGAFCDDTWVPAARALVADGLAEMGERDATFEVGALLLGRSWGQARWLDAAPDEVAASRPDVERAIEIAERIGSGYLLSHALDGLAWLVTQEGACGAASMGERLQRAANSIGNRVEAHESLTEAAFSFARAGAFEQARRIAAETTRRAARLSPHRRLHAAAAEVVACAPSGHLTELLDATDGLEELAEAEGERMCSTGLLALAGRALVLHEAGEADELDRVTALLWRLAPDTGAFRSAAYAAAELLHPVLGTARTARLLAETERRDHTGATIDRLRVTLPVLAAGGDGGDLARAIADARALAGRACAPALAWIADLAEAAAWGRAGQADRAIEQAQAAADALDRHGERYTAARLLAEVVDPVDDRHGAALAERLADMGALASARALRKRAEKLRSR